MPRTVQELRDRILSLESSLASATTSILTLDMKSTALDRQLTEQVDNNSLLQERNNNLESQLHDELQWADALRRSLETVLFDQDLMEAIASNEENSQLDILFHKSKKDT